MITQKTLARAPGNGDNPPTYDDIIVTDETRIPMVKADVNRPANISRETIRANQSASDDSTGCGVSAILCAPVSIFPILGLVLTLWAHLAAPGSIRNREAAMGFGYVFLIGSYLCIYLPVVLCCHRFNKLLVEMMSESEFQRYADKIKQGQPRIIWKMTCFHEEDRTVTITAPSGTTRTERHHEKVTTWSGEREFVFSHWEDVTRGDAQRLDSGGYHIVTSSIGYVLSNCRTREAYAEQKGTFINANKHQDREYAVEEIVDISGAELNKKMVVRMSCSWFLSWPVYVIASVLLLAYPYIWIAKCLEKKTTVRIIKKVSM